MQATSPSTRPVTRGAHSCPTWYLPCAPWSWSSACPTSPECQTPGLQLTS